MLLVYGQSKSKTLFLSCGSHRVCFNHSMPPGGYVSLSFFWIFSLFEAISFPYEPLVLDFFVTFAGLQLCAQRVLLCFERFLFPPLPVFSPSFPSFDNLLPAEGNSEEPSHLLSSFPLLPCPLFRTFSFYWDHFLFS